MPKEKYEAKQAIKDEKKGDAGDKYSVEALRANMSTGGGEPIDKGKKMTNEKRVLQPRDPDTGHFTYNADAQYGLKYKQRAKGAVPVGARSWVLDDGIKKGDKVNINDKVWIAIADMDKDAVIEYFKKFDENSGEYYTEKKSTAEDEGPFTKNQGIGEGFSSNFIRKRGRPSKAEKQGIEQGKRIVGNLSPKAMNALSKTSKQEMADKFAEKAKGIVITDYSTVGIAPALSGAKLAENELKNKLADEKKAAGASAGAAGTPAVAGAGAGAPATPTPTNNEPKEQPKQEEPKQKEQKPTYTPSKENIAKNPKAEYEANKEYWDEKVKKYNEKNGTTHSGAWLVQALAKKYGSK